MLCLIVRTHIVVLEESLTV